MAPPRSLAPSDPAIRGTQMSIWGDGPSKTDAAIETDSMPMMRVIAQRA